MKKNSLNGINVGMLNDKHCMKKYYAKIDMQDLEVIQDKTLKYLIKIRSQLENNSAFQVFLWKPFVEHVPELLTAFDHLNMEVTQICAFFLDNQPAAPHRDDTLIPIRVNVPILNTTNTFTCFYEPKDPDTLLTATLQPNGLPYNTYDKHNIQLMDQCEIIEPTLIRPQEIHNVETVITNPTPRITLTMVLNPMPYEYFPDIELNDRIPYHELHKMEIMEKKTSSLWYKPDLKY